MKNRIWILGTGTDVGKTVFSAGLLWWLRKRSSWGYLKPVLSGARRSSEGIIPGDALFVAQATGLTDDPMDMVPNVYETPCSPHLAARIEGRPVDYGKICSAQSCLSCRYDGLVWESAGGPGTPLDDDGTMMVNLVQRWPGVVLLVCPGGVGSIGQTLAVWDFLRLRGVSPSGLVQCGVGLNSTVEEENRVYIQGFTKVPFVAALPWIERMSPEGAVRCFNAGVTEPLLTEILT